MAKTKKATNETVKATALLRKGTLACIGLYGAAFERAKFRFEHVRAATDTFSTTTSKVCGVLPTASNDRVEELEAEVVKLNKKRQQKS